MTPQEIEALKSERDSLAAQVEALRSAYRVWVESDVGDALIDAFESTPQQCLRDVQAEAGRKGYFEGFRAGLVIDAPVPPPQAGVSAIDHFRVVVDRAAKVNADNYAATVRQGGE